MANQDGFRDEMKELLGELAGIDGVAGHEQAVVARLKELFEPLAHEVTVDSFGNLYAAMQPDGDGPTLMISAHSDEIGALVKSIEPSGMIRFERVGGSTRTRPSSLTPFRPAGHRMSITIAICA